MFDSPLLLYVGIGSPYLKIHKQGMQRSYIWRGVFTVSTIFSILGNLTAVSILSNSTLLDLVHEVLPRRFDWKCLGWLVFVHRLTSSCPLADKTCGLLTWASGGRLSGVFGVLVVGAVSEPRDSKGMNRFWHLKKDGIEIVEWMIHRCWVEAVTDMVPVDEIILHAEGFCMHGFQRSTYFSQLSRCSLHRDE